MPDLKTPVGIVLPGFLGAYEPARTYGFYDIVLYEGDSYIAIGPTTGNAPTDTAYWQRLTDVATMIQAGNQAADEAILRLNALYYDLLDEKASGAFVGEKGDPGEDGTDGVSFTVLGLYESLALLAAAHPAGSTGEAYAVGTEDSNVIYIWDAGAAAWVSVGVLMGPRGPKGDRGDKGERGDPGEKGEIGPIGPRGFTGDEGPRGPQGIQGEVGPQGERGPQGEKGDTGEKGDVGDIGPQGPEGPAGPGFATGGASGYFLAKASSANYDTTWKAVTPATINAASLTEGKVTPLQASAEIVRVTVGRTLMASDAGRYLEVDSATGVTIGIPTDSLVEFAIGTEIEIAQEGAGGVIIAPNAGVVLYSYEGRRTILGQHATAALKKVGANNWRLFGALK